MDMYVYLDEEEKEEEHQQEVGPDCNAYGSLGGLWRG